MRRRLDRGAFTSSDLAWLQSQHQALSATGTSHYMRVSARMTLSCNVPAQTSTAMMAARMTPAEVQSDSDNANEGAIVEGVGPSVCSSRVFQPRNASKQVVLCQRC